MKKATLRTAGTRRAVAMQQCRIHFKRYFAIAMQLLCCSCKKKPDMDFRGQRRRITLQKYKFHSFNNKTQNRAQNTVHRTMAL